MERGILAILLILGAAEVSLARSTEVGNGGDAVVCYKHIKPYVQLFDLYEGRVLRRHEVSYEFSKQADRAEAIFAKLEQLSALRAQAYRRAYAEFSKQANFLLGVHLPDVKDSNEVVLPKGCEIEQMIIQLKPQFPGDFKYIVDMTLWQRLDEVNRFAAILHEVIYSEALRYGAKDSRGVRYLNALINSKQFMSLSEEEFCTSLAAAGLPCNYQEEQ
ncbi:hypothetical protein [Bdellovibrio sp. ArHS]|uniref:hypothetical protein n=1 Tax=Bdellovibrio sp. ArHS TaxID=1569284 RepID=UPI0005A4582C|nr:hypothetical protein [Bdellovibrio sp. ArHS]